MKTVMKMSGIKRDAFLLALCLGVLMLFTAENAWANEQAKTETTKSELPPVYYRGSEYYGVHCAKTSELENNDVQEVFIIDFPVQYNAKVPSGRLRSVQVSEFLSGKRYKADLKQRNGYRWTISDNGKEAEIKCGYTNILNSSGKHTFPLNKRGDYLNVEFVDAETGKWGDKPIINSCDAGELGWQPCDIGTVGFSYRSADGSVIWSRIIAVANKYKSGHPVWGVEDALEVSGEYLWSTMLQDGSALFTFALSPLSNKQGVKGPTIRINMKDGVFPQQHANVAVLPLDDWAALKHVLWKRWNGPTSPCKGESGPIFSPCFVKTTQMYFQLQQSYLFPLFEVKTR